MFRRRDDEEDFGGAQSTGQANFGGNNEAPTARERRDAGLNEEAADSIGQQRSSGLFKESAEPVAKSGLNSVTPSKPAYKLNSSGAFTTNSAPEAPAAPAHKPTTGSPSSKFEGVEAERRLTVGYGITLEGKVSNCDKLIIYGTVDAELNDVKTLHISESGRFTGSAHIEQAEISGTFEGDINVEETIVINSTGRVNGKITYGSIEIRPGGKFTGQIVEAGEAAAAKPAAKKKTTKKAQPANEEFTLAPEPLSELEKEGEVA